MKKEINFRSDFKVLLDSPSGLPTVCLPGAAFGAINETVCTQDEKDLF